jgi:hypothetical protein
MILKSTILHRSNKCLFIQLHLKQEAEVETNSQRGKITFALNKY